MAALHEAVLTGNLDCVKLLVKYGADIHQRDENGWTPLHMACSDGYADIARYGLRGAAELTAHSTGGSRVGAAPWWLRSLRRSRGRWAVSLPVREARARPGPGLSSASCRYLLSLGASLEATTDDGEKPSDLIDPEYEDLVQLFGAAALR